MTKRLMTLIVVSGLFFSGAKAATQTPSIQEFAQRTCSDLWDIVSDAWNQSSSSISNAIDEVEEQIAQEVGSCIALSSNKKGTHLTVIKLGDGADVPMLVLDSIKKLTQAISPEQAAVLYIEIFQEVMDETLKTMPSAIKEGVEKLERLEDAMALFGSMMQSLMIATRERALELAVTQAALPKEICQECEDAMIASGQQCIAKYSSELHATDFTTTVEEEPFNQERVRLDLDKEALTDFMSEIMIDYLNGIVEAITATLKKHYPKEVIQFQEFERQCRMQDEFARQCRMQGEFARRCRKEERAVRRSKQ